MRDIKKAVSRFINKRKVLILGYGTEGRSTYHMLRNYFPKLEICIADQNTDIAHDKELQDDPYLSWVLGQGYMKVVPLYALVFKSPGISFKEYQPTPGQQISSQTDLFINLFHKQIIGITGTKGKSTTASLIYHLLKENDKKVFLVGNIGKAALDTIEQINEDTLIVYELSSHQLEFVTHSPHIAVFLNLYEEHLDHYVSFLDYQLAKENITSFQSEEDYLIYNSENFLVSKRVRESGTQARLIPFGFRAMPGKTSIEGNKLYMYSGRKYKIDTLKIKLLGRHNLLNIMASLNVCEILNIDIPKAIESVYTFRSLPHRLEEVGVCKGIRFINDSIATIPEAAIKAADTFDDLQILILGGYNRGIDYSILVDYLMERRIPVLILTGEVGKLLRELLEEEQYDFPLYDAGNMDEIVDIAYKKGHPGGVCLLSPAASSYDNFHNFMDRGDQFKKKVLEKCQHL